MKTLKNFFYLMITAGLVVSCASNDDDGGGTTNPVKDGVIASQTDPDLDPLDLKGDITADITLSSNINWILNGPLNVKDGATLTIEPGTTIRATPGGTNVFVAVEQGGKINAAGTAGSPIRFTSNSGNPRSGDWGGLLLIGKAPISGGGTATTEVVALTYGGTEAADNSGTLTYVIVEYTGARINGEKEFNGITFYGVGSGTVVNNIASLYGDDDAVEWFGGTVSVSNLLVVNAKDDMFDWTQGWTGNGNNFYGIREAGFNDVTEDPRGIEGDGNLDGNSPGDAGQSNPTIDGITIISNSVIQMADMIKIRRGSGATITNAFVSLGAGASAGDFVDLTDGKGDAIASTTITVVGNNIDINDVKPGANNATINASEGTTGAVNTSIFSWTGYFN